MENNNSFVVIDVETPNGRNNRISAIGLAVINNWEIEEEYYFLVNPEQPFDKFNIKLTGITPEMVSDKPTFKELWQTLEPILKKGPIVAHNASFDVSVLAKCISDYGIKPDPDIEYVCTYQMARNYLPGLSNHQLSTICEHLNIPLQHHNASSDCGATAKMFLKFKEKELNLSDYISTHTFSKNEKEKNHSYIPKQRKESEKLHELETFLNTISSDGEINLQEFKCLQSWLIDNSNLRNNYPYDKVCNEVNKILEDGEISQKELDELLSTCKNAFDPLSGCTCDCFDISNKTFVLTGEFEYGSRPEVEQRLVSKGGISQNGVTKKTDYVIVGNKGSDFWLTGNYGTKIKKALELQDKGINIQIIKEGDISI